MFENLKVPSELIPSDPRFGAGPSLVPTKFIESLLQTGNSYLGTSHRKPAVKNIVKEIQEGLEKYFSLPKGYEVVLGNGGATLLFDAIALGLVEKKSSHFVTGEFSGKWFKSHDLVPWIEAEEFKVDFGQGLTPKTTNADTICMTLNETSTGVIIDEIPEVGDDQIICVDATSGGGQVPCDLSKTDVFFFSPQKVFASDGGLFIAIMSPKAIDRALKIDENKERYIPGVMNWKTAIENSRKNQTYTTPALATLFILNEQIKELNKVGYQKVIELGQEKAKLIYSWAEEKSYLSPYVADPKYRSSAVATIDIDEKFPSSDLTKALRGQGIAIDIDSYRKLGRNQLRIALFHNIAFDDLKKLTQIVSLAIEQV